MERRYSVPPSPLNMAPGVAPPADAQQQAGPRSHPATGLTPSTSEDLHAWSIYRQNLNSDFTDSALGSSEKSPLPYGNFQLRESTVQSILSHPRYGPKSALGTNMYTYLKFGLPRVFPPSRGPRDGSSGYDSSDDGSPYLHRQGRNYLRSRSDPDFRNQPLHRPVSQAPRPVPHPHVGGRGDAWVRAKSHSEANLLSQEMYMKQQEHRRSVHDLRATSYPDVDQPGRRTSKAGSHASLAHGRRGPHTVTIREDGTMNGRLGPAAEAGMLSREAYYAPLPEHGDGAAVFKYPHLQVRGLEVESGLNKGLLLLQGISFEVRGGEILAVMATTEEEGSALLDVLAGRTSRAGAVRGDVMLNGSSVGPGQLRDRVACVRADGRLCADLSVRRTLCFHHRLRRVDGGADPSSGKVEAQSRIDSLIEDLGLDQVRSTKVANLTTSEKRRLNVACHLLLNTDIVVLDQPTRGMDIFDTFFLVEFLRQWAASGANALTGGLTGGRIVILTLHPPTYEIFTMLSRVVLLSAGRIMFSGRRRDMLPYFAMVDYPCPAYKNPSDYYLDLVTLDDLSAEAMLESSQRIEQLAETFRRRQDALSDPGPPVALPAKIKHANFFVQIFALFIRAMAYAQPISLLRWTTHVLLAASMSLAIGVVFWDVPRSDPGLVLGDRPGFHYAMALVGPWPLWLLMSVGEVGRERWPVDHDVRDRLYGRPAYILAKVAYNLPASACVWLAYVIPAYTMSGLYIQGPDSQAFYIYSGYMLLHLLAVQMLLTACGHALKHRRPAALLAGLPLACLSLASGLPAHPRDLGPWCSWLGSASPARWLLPPLLRREHSAPALAGGGASLVCRSKQVQHQDIIVQMQCPPPNGTAALEFMGLLRDPREPEYMPPVAVAVFWFLCFLVAAGSFLACRYRPTQPRNNPNKP
ncbi:ATP-binding cassette sub-family G member 8 [Bacillus rossius redtenbacheri]|uniref:ATP-binding cassette sub-family G member 8 n=1 Tax=Bacillus rossius redtenbacheri TaxID=93214 RepID=UPI002FDD4A99